MTLSARLDGQYLITIRKIEKLIEAGQTEMISLCEGPQIGHEREVTLFVGG